MMNTALQAIVTKALPALSGEQVTYNAAKNVFLSQGYKITYLEFTIDHDGAFVRPTTFDQDYWRSMEGPRRFSHMG